MENGPVEIIDLPSYIAWWFSSSLCKRLPEGKPPFSYGFPMVFPLKPPFSYGKPHLPGKLPEA
jgi:hypothetical protein